MYFDHVFPLSQFLPGPPYFHTHQILYSPSPSLFLLQTYKKQKHETQNARQKGNQNKQKTNNTKHVKTKKNEQNLPQNTNVFILCWQTTWKHGPTGKVFVIHNDTPLEKTDFPFAKKYPL